MSIRYKLFALFLFAAPAMAQNVRYDNVAFTTAGLNAAFIANATITVCTSAGSGLPCTPKVSGLCLSASDASCTQPNPTTGDALGNYGFWIQPGTYVVTVTKAGLNGYSATLTLACQIGSSCTLTGLVTFNAGITGTGSIGALTAPYGNLTGFPAACGANLFSTQIAATPGCTQPSASNLSNGITGSGAVVLATSPTLTTPVISSPTVSGTVSGGPSIAGFTVPSGTSASIASGGSIALSSGSSVNSQSNLLISGTSPTISSGFGTSPSISAASSSASFTINVGTGGTATSGVIGLSTAVSGWNVFCEDVTTFSTTVFRTRQTATSTTTATIGNFNSSAASVAWAANDILSCIAFAR